MQQVLFDYTRQDAHGASCVAHAWAKVRPPLSREQRLDAKARAAALLKRQRAVLVAHYYVAATTRPARWSSPACASWARRRRSCRRTSAC